MGECSVCIPSEGAIVWCFISVSSRVVLYNISLISMYLSSLVSGYICFKMCISMVEKFEGLRFMLPWGVVGPGGPSLGQRGELLSTASPPMATDLSRVKHRSGRVGGGSCLAHTSTILHRLFCGSFPPGVHRFAKVSPDNVNGLNNKTHARGHLT